MAEELDFGIGTRIRSHRREVLRRANDCVDSIGWEVAVGASQMRRQDLSDMLSNREGRRVEIMCVWGVAMVAPEELRAALARSLVEPLGYGVAPIRPLTAEERLARLEYRVATELGEAGKRVVEENKR